MSEVKKRNEYLGMIEGLATYGVVMIHCRFPGIAGEVLAEYFWFAVPFFFTVSGYFYFNSDSQKSISRTKRKILHLIPMVVVAETLYYLWYCFLYIRKYGFSLNAFYQVVKNEIDAYNPWAITDLFPLFSPACWFVFQLIIAYLAWHFILKHRLKKVAYYFIPVSFICVTILSHYMYQNYGFSPAFYIDKWCIFNSIPFFSMGFWLHENQKRIMKQSYAIQLIFLAVGMILIGIEMQFWLDIGLCLGHVFVILGIFGIAVKKRDQKITIPILKLFDMVGEKYSLYIYLFHMWAFGFMDTVIRMIWPYCTDNVVWMWMRPIMACVVSTVVAIVCYYIMSMLKRIHKSNRQLRRKVV